MGDIGLEGARRLRQLGVKVGDGARAWLGERVEVEADAEVGPGATLVADRLYLGAGARVGAGCDVRAGSVAIGQQTELQDSVSVLAADAFEVDAAGRIERAVNIQCRSFQAGKLFYFGHDSSVGYGGTTASTALVRIGDRVALGPRNILNANYPIELADQVGSGCDLTVWTHGFHFGHRLLDGYAADFEGVRVDANVWLGFHVTLLPGVRIGANTIVAAGAVVARSLPGDVLAGGVPAKPIKPLSAEPVGAAAAARLIAELLERWRAELAWKGVTCTSRGDGSVLVRDTVVTLLGSGDPLPAADPVTTLIALAVEPRPDLRGGRADTVVLELRDGVCTGQLNEVGHDLRDFLRRNAMPCGDNETFRSLPAAPFARLEHPQLSANGFLT